MTIHKVSIFKRKGQRVFYMQYRDPRTGNKIRKSTGTNIRREAERAAERWEKEIREQGQRRYGDISWDEFRRRYEDEVLSTLAPKTDAKVTGVFNVLERVVQPKRLRDLDEEALSSYQRSLADQGRATTTIKGHLAHIVAALNWGVDQKLMTLVPRVKMPKRAKRSKVMKGRPITLEEFERMLDKVEDALADPPSNHKPKKPPRDEDVKRRRNQAIKVAPSWQFFLKGLWWSGLRLAESLELHWTDASKLHIVNLDGREPLLSVPAELEKGNRDRLMPLVPEFVEFLREQVPEHYRHGYVFDPRPRRERYGDRLSAHHVGRTISSIGQAANVKVSERTDGDKTIVKYASAHDLRRSFGERWSGRVMPQVLMELMRHESIETTMRYYVGRNAKAMAKGLWQVYQENQSVEPHPGPPN